MRVTIGVPRAPEIEPYGGPARTLMWMVRLVAGLAALAAMAGLAACGSDEAMPAPGPEGSQASGAGTISSEAPQPGARAGVLTGTLPLLNGERRDLERYRGKVVIVVNTASECGFTPQFESLEALYQERRDDGLVILGFPADDVAGQEPRSDAEIAEFCEANFGVSFPMFAKSNVVSEPRQPALRAPRGGGRAAELELQQVPRSTATARWSIATTPAPRPTTRR